jgi:hypothetical protein
MEDIEFWIFLSLEIQLYYKDWFWKKEKLIVCQVCSHLRANGRGHTSD